MTQSAKPEAHGNLAGESADRRSGNRIDAALLDVARVIQPVLLFGKLLAAASGSDDDADTAQLVPRHRDRLEARVEQRFFNSGDAKRNGARYVLAVLGRDVEAFIEINHLAGDLHGVLRC